MRARGLKNEAEDEDVGETEEAKKFVNIDHFLTTSPAHGNRKSGRSKTTEVECIELNKEQRLELLLSMIASNIISFSIVGSESFRRNVLFLRENSPLVNHVILKWTFPKLYNGKTKLRRDTFADITGRFVVTINEWNPSNNIDPLGITLHFPHNDL